MPHWIFISPHPDDAVYSCGGFIWEQLADGEKVEIWTLFAADPPKDGSSAYAQELHARWKTGQNAMAVRRSEDRAACAGVGASLPVSALTHTR